MDKTNTRSKIMGNKKLQKLFIYKNCINRYYAYAETNEKFSRRIFFPPAGDGSLRELIKSVKLFFTSINKNHRREENEISLHQMYKTKLSFHLDWSEEDTQYVVLCPQFPSLSWLADSPEEALIGMKKLIDEVKNYLGK